MIELFCDGNCIETHGEHKGAISFVKVSDDTFHIYYLHYCENAIEEDIKRGFTVEKQDI